MALAAAAALALPLLVVQGAAAQTTVPACGQPELREAMVSQGLPSYAALARGKETLVKLFLSRRQNCSATITVQSAKLRLSSAVAVHPILDAANAPSSVELPAWELAPLADSRSDPYFVVPGAVLTPAGVLDPRGYDLGLSVELVYNATYAGKKYTGVMTFSDVRGTPISARVAREAQPVRVLVVPMGDADLGYSGVFTESARSALPTAMQSLQRVLPVADGIGSIESETGGLRYSVAPSPHLVDLGPHQEMTINGPDTVSYLNPDGTFCGTARSWRYLQVELAEARTAWNSVRPVSQHADRVLGVVAQESSHGQTTSGAFCADGYAAVGLPESWVRLVHTSKAPDAKFVAGYLTALEVGHTLGAVVGTPSGSYHSSATQADGTARDRAYNVARRAFLPDDRPTMAYAPTGAHDDNTLYEPGDWALAQCVLVNGLAGTACPQSPSTIGATTAAGGALHLSGTTDGTPRGTFAHTYVVDQGQDERTPDDTAYAVELLDSKDEVIAVRGLPVAPASSHHGDDPDSGHTHDSTGVFDASFDAEGAYAFAIVTKDAGGGRVELYRRELDGPPVIETVSTTGGRSTFAGTPEQERDADVSPDGRWIAWEEGDRVLLRRSDRAGPPAAALAAAADPEWSPDGSRLAFVTAGALRIVDVTTSGDGASLGTPALVYTPVARGSASSPSWSPDGRRLVVALEDKGLMIIDDSGRVVDCVEDAECVPLLVGPASDPSWSPARDAGRSLIAYEQRMVGDGQPTVLTVDPSTPVPARRAAGEDPAWGGGRLLFTTPEGIRSLDAETFDDGRAEPTLAGDRQPSASADGSLLSVTGSDGTSDDVHLVTPAREHREVVASDDHPEQLRLDVFVECPSGRTPVATGLYGKRKPGTDTVAFDVELDAGASCPGGRPVYRVTDGFTVRESTGAEVLAGDALAVVSVTSPRPGDVVAEGSPLPLDLDGWNDGQRQEVAWEVLAGERVVESGTWSSADTTDVTAALAPGEHVLKATASGRVAYVPFLVAGDADRDGLLDAVDSRAVHHCYPSDALTSPTNAVTDYDGDLLVGRSDPHPCTSAMTARVSFEPQTVDLNLDDTPLTLTVTSPLDARAVTVDSVRLTQMGGFPVSVAPMRVHAIRSDTFQVKVDRRIYTALARELGLTQGYVPVVITAQAGGRTTAGFDARSPVHKS